MDLEIQRRFRRERSAIPGRAVPSVEAIPAEALANKMSAVLDRASGCEPRTSRAAISPQQKKDPGGCAGAGRSEQEEEIVSAVCPAAGFGDVLAVTKRRIGWKAGSPRVLNA
jgi:hypothetical protein